jgi:hypothetical protein
MKKMIWIKEAKALDGYKMIFVFNDGSRKSFDFKPLIEKQTLYKPLKDKSLFNDFKLDGWTVSWADGTIDIAPEFLYENGIPCFDEEIASKVAEEQAPYGK